MDFRKFTNVKRADLENEDELDKTEDEAEEPAQGFSSMRELYDALDIGDGGSVYLSDGVWLCPDGSVED